MRSSILMGSLSSGVSSSEVGVSEQKTKNCLGYPLDFL